MKSFSQRSSEHEIMDDPSVGFEEFAETLKQLENINQRTRAYDPILQFLHSLLPALEHKEPLRVLDVGCGYGDTLRAVHRWAQAQKVKVELTGLDLSPWSKKAADTVTPADWNIRFITGDVFQFKMDPAPDCIINSLFTHHLQNDQIIELMRWMTQNAKRGWFISDLHRHFLSYYFVRYWVRREKYNRLITHDAPASVARAFVKRDWEHYLQRAGIPRNEVKIEWNWPFRWGIKWTKPAE